MATLDHIDEIAENKGLDDDLSVIYPPANYNDDFYQDTIFDKVIIKPLSTTPVGTDQGVGLKIENADNYPLLDLKGGAGNGNGLITFGNAGGGTASISSQYNDDFVFNKGPTANAIKFEASGNPLLKILSDRIEIPSGIELKYEGGADIQTQINNLDNLYSTDTERVNAVNSLVTNYTNADTVINTALQTQITSNDNDITAIQTVNNTQNTNITNNNTNITSNTLKHTQNNNTPSQIFVDSNRADTYTEDGSKVKPYKNLNTALAFTLTDNNTTTYCLKLAAGSYVGTFSIDKTTANQSFVIEGSGKDVTFIKGSSAWDGAVGNVLYFRDFNNIEIKNLTIQYGAYGFYPRSCKKIVLRNVKFLNNGSAGTVNRHDQTGTQAEQAAYWASNSTSNGGATRIRSCEEVLIFNCEAQYCARGFRIQDCGKTGKNSIITGCKTFRVLEGSFYLASGSYDGNSANGCNNFTVSNNVSEEGFNNGLLCIGGTNNTFISNTVIKSANAGIMFHHSLDNRAIDNYLSNCNKIVHNGVGAVNGDNLGNIYVQGNTNIASGEYIVILEGNISTNCGGSSVGLIMNCAAYPSASNKFINQNNSSDATTRFTNTNNIPQTEVAESASAFDGNLDDDLICKGSAVFNEDGLSTKGFRIESDNKTHMFFVDPATDRVGIGRNAFETPSRQLHVANGIQCGLIQATTYMFGATTISATANEVNLLDGGNIGTSISLVDGDRFLVNDAGVMKQCYASDIKTYIGGGPPTAVHYLATGGGSYNQIDNTIGTVICGFPSSTQNGATWYIYLPDITTISSGHTIRIISGMSPIRTAYFRAKAYDGTADASFVSSYNDLVNDSSDAWMTDGTHTAVFRMNQGNNSNVYGNVYAASLTYFNDSGSPKWYITVG